jgi:hypothetical protein
MANSNLSQAKNLKNDEFYTQLADIEREAQAYLDYNPDVFCGKSILCPCDDPELSNFTKFFAMRFRQYGIRKLISTSYAHENNNSSINPIASYEHNKAKFDIDKRRKHGKIFVLDSQDIAHDGAIEFDDLKWDYLQGDGDFRSDEIKKLCAEADIIVTNPPFSLFREFLALILDTRAKFLIIGNMNAITYKDVFPLIMGNKLWLGLGFKAGNAYFLSPVSRDYANGVFDPDSGLVKFRNCCWFTNLDHGRRHRPLPLMAMADILNSSRHKKINGQDAYERYDNYDAIEVPFTDAIPDDYDGMMGVPISFLDKYCPEQFEIMGMCENIDLYGLKTKVYSGSECQRAYFAKFGKKGSYDLNASGVVFKDGLLKKVYQRIIIKKRKNWQNK